ncbi:hypothetical protein [Luteitalea pratensis]|nr:hypothetical protein [Luteitalea pratensis]
MSSPSYPRMVLDDGTLYVAWSSDRTVEGSTYYRSIHVVRSPDGALTWANLAGAALIPPFAGDERGDTTEITLPSERVCVTWLTGFAITHGMGHFFYLASLNALERGCALRKNLVAQSARLNDHLYAIGGQRSVARDGLPIGSYTDDSLSPDDVPSAVRLFSVRVQ